ncbi:hypothetical protein ETD83_29515 [Actinomadura soli]|uniref:VWFA domain-containing protein n=1 Tax=Actinomadura soli TaxID=2508997 RepID=A0A5C4J4D2_9ACTN|nr:hypothetical protein [Actinomadura soli]TMQ91742.1 hypothetical protein ETD83_29515 [Actinomadura soli]
MPTLVIALFDDSGSVVSTGGTDPAAQRFAEVGSALSLVARYGSSHELGAILHFDSPSHADVAPVPLTRHGVARLRTGLRVPPDGAGSSVLAPSLARPIELATGHPDHAVTLVLLSDFQILDPDPRRTLAELTAFPGRVHAVVLGSQVGDEVFDRRISVSRIDQHSQPGAVGRALFASLVAHRPGSSVRAEP